MSFLKRIKYEEELSKIKLDENLKKYYQENPEKREEYLKKLNSLRDRIVEDEEIGSYYKKSFLSSIEKNRNYLNEGKNQILEVAFPLLVFILGFMARGKLEEFFQNYNKELALDINKTIKEELKCLYG
ncbi:MAG: hypothetical protein ACP5O8_04050, partial [Candidatus Aenigmatarchaeota archaeon]